MSRFREALAAATDRVQQQLDVQPRSYTRSPGGVVLRSRSKNLAERIEPPRAEIEKYWRLYQTTPLIRASFNQFGDDIVAEGYRVQADEDETKEFLAEWCETAAVIAGERNRDLHDLIRGIPIQHEARGTAVIEHAPARQDPDAIAGLTFVNPATLTPYRQPGTSMLVRPGDTEYDNIKLTDDGKAAAYVQYDRERGYGSDDSTERRLAQTDVTKIANDPDTGDIFGTSSVEPVATRVEALRKKLASNEQAIESMAWGQWFFGFEAEKVDDGAGGEKLIEWSDDDKDDFMDDLREIEPGDQIGHDGTVNVENIPGEVADILDNLKFDVDYVLSAMPAPTYSVGFETDINQFVVDGQEERHEQRISAIRGRIERALTPVLKQVAEQNDYDPSGVRLRLDADEGNPLLTDPADRLEAAKAVSEAAGGDPLLLFDRPELRKLLFDVSPEPGGEMDLSGRQQAMQELSEQQATTFDESDPAVQRGAEALGMSTDGMPAPEGGESDVDGDVSGD